MNKEKALENLISYSFNLQINMNDTFHYACGDVGEINSEDALDLLPFIDIYGFDACVAYEAIKRGYDPEIPQHVSKEFLEVKQLLLTKMNEDINFLCDLNYTKRKEAKQIAKYGGILSFKFTNPSWWEKIKGQKYLTCICVCSGQKIVGKGKNMMEAETHLCKQLGVKYED